MTISFACSGCGKELRVAEAMAGRKGKCPHCMTIVVVPTRASIPEDATPASNEEPIRDGDVEQEAIHPDEQGLGHESLQEDPAAEACQVFKMLSDGTRFAILRELGHGPKNVGALCEALGLGQPTVSHHLGLMRNTQVVESRRQGKEIFYSINEARIRQAADTLADFLRA